MAAKGKGKTQEQIVAGFQELRQQQRAVAGKISELNGDLKEHELVLHNYFYITCILTTCLDEKGETTFFLELHGDDVYTW